MTEAMVDDALVSRVAQVLYNLTMPPLARDWEQEARGVREWYEKQAKGAIAIAYPAGVAAGRDEAAEIAEKCVPGGYMSDRERSYCADHGEDIATAIRQRGK